MMLVIIIMSEVEGKVKKCINFFTTQATPTEPGCIILDENNIILKGPEIKTFIISIVIYTSRLSYVSVRIPIILINLYFIQSI